VGYHGVYTISVKIPAVSVHGTEEKKYHYRPFGLSEHVPIIGYAPNI
jgi:hypothetical protein